MSAPRLLTVSMFALTLVTACGAQMKPDFERNPHPRDAYRLRVVLKNPPGPLDFHAGSTSYEVSNLPCAVVSEHPTHANQPVAGVPFTMKKVAENTYEGVFYTDAMVDKDYFGNGICHWYLTSAGASFRASNTPGGTVFSVGFPMADVITHEPTEYMKGVHTTIYFPRSAYPRIAGVDDFPMAGDEDRGKLDKLRDDELFQAEVSLDKATTP